MLVSGRVTQLFKWINDQQPLPGTPEAERAALRAKLRILPSPKGWVFHTTVDVIGMKITANGPWLNQWWFLVPLNRW